MSDELFQFIDDKVVITVFLDPEEVTRISEEFSRVTAINPPFIETFKNGLHLTIPWKQQESE